ncbi:MAG TPA: HAD-IA family hydrolase, partial [Candidatus Binataceae bacterium]|nr:HAD-IA family hydrolase [Candidatus Binataceae bacterium]
RARLRAGGDTARAVLARGELAAAALRAMLDGASAIIERHELAGVGAVAPAPGAIELLGALRAAGGTVAIVTSNSSRTIEAWMRAHETRSLVDVIVGRDSGLALKPSPAMVERVLEACDVAPADAAFVGDSEADFGAAAAAEVRFYGVNARVEGRDRLSALGASPVFSSPAAMAIYFNLLDPPMGHKSIGRSE